MGINPLTNNITSNSISRSINEFLTIVYLRLQCILLHSSLLFRIVSFLFIMLCCNTLCICTNVVLFLAVNKVQYNTMQLPLEIKLSLGSMILSTISMDSRIVSQDIYIHIYIPIPNILPTFQVSGKCCQKVQGAFGTCEK